MLQKKIRELKLKQFFEIQHLLSNISEDSKNLLKDYDSIVQSVRPLSSKQQQILPNAIKNLSHLLTDERGARRTGYLNDTVTLSAYVRYFQWWNLLRLVPLFSSLETQILNLSENSVCLDIGSGPLTVPIALWIACPHLRTKKLHWYCLDHSHGAMALGEDLFLAVVAKTAQETNTQLEPWKITRIKGELGTPLREKANFVVCANMFNEVVQISDKPPEYTAKKAVSYLSEYASEGGRILVVEPGIPPSVRFLSAFRSFLLRKKYKILAPCPHALDCAMDGRKGGKWCHFVLPVEYNTMFSKLKKLSVSAGLPKDRLTFSFILAAKEVATLDSSEKEQFKFVARIASDSIKLPRNLMGYYACSEKGLTLFTETQTNKKLTSGDLVTLFQLKKTTLDKKTGATVISLN